MVGSAVCRALRKKGFNNLVTADRKTLDLTDQRAVFDFFAANKPDTQIICAAVVGGIVANETYPGDFIGKNLMIQTNLLEAARRFGCNNNLFTGSSCIYPRNTSQPMREDQLLTGTLEPTNQWYAMAKLAGIKMGQAYRKQYGMNIISVLPTNLYGPGDNFDLEYSHVVPGLLHKAHIAKTKADPYMTVWGSGRAMREFLHVDDLAEALVFLMRQDQEIDIVNVGCGKEISIMALVEMIKEITGYTGELRYDNSKPDGTPRKLMDTTRMNNLGWHPRIPLRKGLADTYAWFLQNANNLRQTNLGKTSANAQATA